MNIIIDLPEEKFVSFCADIIINTKQTIEKSICDSIICVLREGIKGFDFFVNISYNHNRISYDKFLSLKEYIDQGHIYILKPEIILECKIVKPSMDLAIIFPEYIRPGHNGSYYPFNFKSNQRLPVSDKKALKTKPKYIFRESEIKIEKDTLIEIYNRLPDIDDLIPSMLKHADDYWRKTFYNRKTGEAYFCNCFKEVIESRSYPKLHNLEMHPHVKYALENNSYKIGICHLCTKTTPDIRGIFSKEPFNFIRAYGAYIYKIMYQNTRLHKEMSFREAENIVRKMVGYPLVGEGWVAETALYKRIKAEFSKIEIIHHGRPLFLKPQEYDIWIPDHYIAVEYQGIQHFEPIGHWGGEEGLKYRQELDARKARISEENNVKLFCVKEGYDFDNLANEIKVAMNEKIKQEKA